MKHFTNLNYCYFFKDSYYFRKIIHHKYLKDYQKNLLYRRSLRLVLSKRIYKYLTNNKEELIRYLNYISISLTSILKKDKSLTIQDINFYIQTTTEEYIKRAIIENSDLEDKRLRKLQGISENGELINGYELQRLSERFKKLDNLYKKMTLNPDKIKDEAIKIIKNSDINLEDVLIKIPANKLNIFYEMTIKAEREISKNDIKIYIKRNIEEFYHLISKSTLNFDEKVDEAHSVYIVLMIENKKQDNYLKFLKQQNKRYNENINIDETSIKEMFEKFSNQKNEEAILNIKSDVSLIIDDFIKFKGYDEKATKTKLANLTPLKDYLQGNGKEYITKDLESLTLEDIRKLEEILSEATPKTRAKDMMNKNIFDLVEIRKKKQLKRYGFNTLKGFADDTKLFWKYYCKYKNKTQGKEIFDSFSPHLIVNKKNFEEEIIEEEYRDFNNTELQILIDKNFDEKEMYRLLLNYPRNFWAFLFGLILGMRLKEIAQLDIEDVKKHVESNEEYYYLYLNANNGKSLKNKNAHRNVPIPNLILDLGFLNYLELRRKRGLTKLFDIPKSGENAITGYFARIFKKFLNLEGSKVCFHSFRQTFITKINELAEAEEELNTNLKRIYGHSEGTTTNIYLGRINPKKGVAILNKSINEDSLNYKNLIDIMNKYYNNKIIKSLDIDSSFAYNTASLVKPQMTRKI